MTPYYEDANTTIYLGDCREVMDDIIDTPALVLTDPPYGDTSFEWDRWPDGWVDALPPLTNQLWCFGSMRMFLAHYREFNNHWTYAQEVVWDKHNGSGFAADRFRRIHEFAMHWYSGAWGSLTLNPQFTTGHERKVVKARRALASEHHGAIGEAPLYDSTERLVQSIITCPSMHGAAIHPTEKPIGILAPLIAYSTNPGDLILDPFAGSCSTARAARSLGRRSICIEANEQYLEAAVKALAQGDLFAATPI